MQSSSDLFSYPNDWSEQALEAVAEINPESLGSSTPSSFQFQYIDISSVNVGVIDWHSVITQVFATAPSRARRIVRPGDVLLSTVRPGLQSHAFADWGDGSDSYICSTGFAVIRAGRALEPRFLRHLVFSNIVTTQLHRLETGSNYPAVPESDVKLLHIPIPPLPEQRRIAEILDAADEAIRQTERVIAKLKAVKAGLLHDLLTCGLDEHGHLRDPQAHPEQFKDSPLGRVPENWSTDSLGNCSFVTKLAGFEYTNYFDYSKHGEIIAVRVLNIRDGRLDLSDVHTIPRSVSDKLPRSALKKGDLVISYVGTIGEVALIEEGNRFHLAPNVARISPSRDMLDPCFLLMQLLSHQAQKRLFDLSALTSQPALSMGRLRRLQIVIPPLEEQTHIAATLDAHDTRIRAEEAELAKLRQVKRGLMDDLLTGRVRVT